VKYDPNGNYLWVKGMGGTGYELNYGVTLDGSGNVLTCGYFLSAPADFNIGGTGGEVNPIGGSGADGFVVKFGCGDTSSSRLKLSECGESFTFNGVTYTKDGTYTQVLSSIGGCDSTVILDLTLYEIEPHITIDKFKLGVTGHYATYQWIKDGKDINGATDSAYIVRENGVYQVRVTNENGCEGTSDEYPINNVSVDELSGTGRQIYIYPNPAKDVLYINSPLNVNISLNSIEGRRLVNVTNVKTTAIKTGNLTPGIYILRITDKEGRLIKVEKIRKQ